MENGDPVPDLIILDWRMPQLSGKEVLTRIRRLPHYTHIPIVIFTGILDPVNLNEAKELGATFFLQKPFNLDDLCRKLEHLFSLDWRNTGSSGRQI
jgi:CheY-like chemotaxis protein